VDTGNPDVIKPSKVSFLRLGPDTAARGFLLHLNLPPVEAATRCFGVSQVFPQ